MNKEMNIDILFENDYMLAINKPAGLMVHGDGKRDLYTLTDWLLERYPEMKHVGEPIETKEGVTIYRPGIVHRLDRDTSGVLLIAKNQEAHEHLKEQFKERKVQKTYRAFTYGELRYDEGEIDKPIGRSKSFGKWSAIPKGVRGTVREAQTAYKVLKRKDGFTYMELYPKTGRTHQIRVHLQYLNYPVVADVVYAGKRFNREQPNQSLGFERQALHAYKITFSLMNGEETSITAPLTEDFIATGFED